MKQRILGKIKIFVQDFVTIKTGVIPSNILYGVANPVHGLLDSTRSEEHLQSYNESMKTKQNEKQENNNTKHMPEKDRRGAL